MRSHTPVPVVGALVHYHDKTVLAGNSQWVCDRLLLVTDCFERRETPEETMVREVREERGLDG